MSHESLLTRPECLPAERLKKVNGRSESYCAGHVWRAHNTPIPMGPIILCPEKGKEITAKLLHINGEMRHGLGTVHKDERADVVSSFANFLYRIDQSQDV